MMRNSIVLVLLVAAASAAYTGGSYSSSPYYGSSSYTGPYHHLYYTKAADQDYLMKQKKIYELLMYVGQNVFTDAEYYEVGHNYDIASNVDYYHNKEAVYEFLDWYKHGWYVSNDALFTYYNQEHREEMQKLYYIFYFAKDFTIFYKTAAWARLFINPGVFVAAFTSAVLYRDDTKYIQLPAIYELYPHLFFDSKVIQQAYNVKMAHGYKYQSYHHSGYGYHGYPMSMKGQSVDVDAYHVFANFTEMYVTPHYYGEEFNKLAYFTEDVDLNAFYYYFRMAFPFWMNTKDYSFSSSHRGEFYFFFHKQLMARWYLERFSNGLGEIEYFSWDKMNLPGFFSELSFYNGVAMPKRDWWDVVPFYKNYYVQYIQMLEHRITDAIDSGFFYDHHGKQYSLYTPEGLNWLGNIIEGNNDSYNLGFYGSYDAMARNILGMNYNYDYKNYIIPSSLQLFSTSMRDPAFYRIYDKIVHFFYQYKNHLPFYPKSELEFPGVKIEDVSVDKLYTFFDNKPYYINNAVAVNSYKEGHSFTIKAWQHFLNYKPFTYKFSVNSDKETKAVLRIFLGPALEDHLTDDYQYMLHYSKYFFMLDHFEVMLKPGMNTFDHHSMDSHFFKHHYESGDSYYHKILKAIEGHEPFHYSEHMYGFPGHLMLPKGSVGGMKYKMFFYIGPYADVKPYEMPIFGSYHHYGKPLGFPLDRPMSPWFFNLHNTYFKDVFIYHEEEKKYSPY